MTHSKDLSKMVSNAAKLVRLLETERWMQVSVACANFKMRNKNAVLAQLQAAGHDDAQDLTNHMVQVCPQQAAVCLTLVQAQNVSEGFFHSSSGIGDAKALVMV